MASGEDEELAALAGFTVAFFKSDSGLWKVFQDAKEGQWSGDRLLAAARNTEWFKKHNESQRQMQLLKTSDPAEHKRRLADSESKVTKLLRDLGVTHSSKFVGNLASIALSQQWNDEQIRAYIGNWGSVKNAVMRGDHLTGLAGQTEREIRKLSSEYGIAHTQGFIANAAQQVVTGKRDLEWYRSYIVDKAKGEYAGIAGDLDSGLTVRQVAEPYIDAMARLWERNPNEINTRDSFIRKALTSRNKDNKPVAQPLWQFEESLRKDPRWNATNNARESYFAAGHKALQDLGMLV